MGEMLSGFIRLRGRGELDRMRSRGAGVPLLLVAAPAGSRRTRERENPVKSPRQPAGRSRTRARAVSEPLEPRRLLSAGDLDPLFGTGGKVVDDFPASAA